MVVLVSKEWEGVTDHSQDGGRVQARARGCWSCSLAVFPLCCLMGRTTSPSGRGLHEGGGAVLCVRLEEPESRGRAAYSDCGHYSFLAITCLPDLPTSTRAQCSGGLRPSFVYELRPRSIVA